MEPTDKFIVVTVFIYRNKASCQIPLPAVLRQYLKPSVTLVIASLKVEHQGSRTISCQCPVSSELVSQRILRAAVMQPFLCQVGLVRQAGIGIPAPGMDFPVNIAPLPALTNENRRFSLHPRSRLIGTELISTKSPFESIG
jgi:hypothetical protein